jgi:hypothetical protein
LSYKAETPFDNLESAHEYLGLLIEAIVEAESELATDISTANGSQNRRLEALRLIHYKLEKLEGHLRSSSRLLNDLRSLRRLLLEERLLPVIKRTGTEG